jgi:hypothetical protein
LAVAHSIRWSRRILSGVTRLTPISLSSARSNAPRTRAPSLDRRYSASPVLRAPPTPVAPGPSAGPLASRPTWPTGLPCCQSARAYGLCPLPRRTNRPSSVGASGRPQRPSSMERGLGARIRLFEACSGFTRVTARTLADPPKRACRPRGRGVRHTQPPELAAIATSDPWRRGG